MHDTSPPSRFPVVFASIVATVLAGGLALYAGLFAAALSRDPTRGHLVSLLYNWQGLMAGVLALGGAGLVAATVLHHARQSRTIAERRRVRRVRALRAALPLLLDGVAEYLADSAKAYARLAGTQTEGVLRASGLAFPALPPESVDHVVGLVEVLDPRTARPLVLFLRNLQVHRARAREARLRAGTAAPVLTRHGVVSHLVETADLYARCAKLFAYAGGESDAPAASPTFRDVQTSLLMLAASFPDTQDLEDEVERRVRHGLQTGLAWPEQ